jgi:trimeric autotransporter adhesin
MKISLKLFSLLAVYLLVSSCNSDEDVSAPPASTLTVNATSGLVGDTEFTFTVSASDAQSVTILPKGEANTGKAGILVSKSQFSGGSTATVKYTYDEPGTFAPVVVTSNFSLDGKSVKRSTSAPLSVTITSNKAAITEFTMDKSTKTTIDEAVNPKTIVVELPYDPYGKANGLTAVKAKFVASKFSTVKVGATEQKSGETANNFTSKVTYVVTAQNGTVTSTYDVTVVVAAVETDNTIKTFSAKSIAKSNKDRVITGSVDNTGKKLVLYDKLGTAANAFDSLRITYELNGKFATASLKKDSLLNFTTGNKSITVTAQDESTGAYTIYAVAAPKFEIAFNGLNPTAAGETTDFSINVNVLKGTAVAALATTSTTTLPAGVTVTGYKADGVAFTSGSVVDFTEPVKFELTVNDTNIGVTYTVIYTAKVTVLP